MKWNDSENVNAAHLPHPYRRLCYKSRSNAHRSTPTYTHLCTLACCGNKILNVPLNPFFLPQQFPPPSTRDEEKSLCCRRRKFFRYTLMEFVQEKKCFRAQHIFWHSTLVVVIIIPKSCRVNKLRRFVAIFVAVLYYTVAIVENRSGEGVKIADKCLTTTVSV